MRTAGVVGLGLMGGSLAMDLRAAGWRVQGEDRDARTVEGARAAGVIEGEIEHAEIDVLILAVPVAAMAKVLRDSAPRLGARTVVTDLGSTKRGPEAAARDAGLEGVFVGSHPMAGDHRSGWGAAREGLFRDAAVWVCPGAAGEAAVSRVEDLWRAVGGRPRRISAGEHDRHVAWSSHLPQLAATALGNAIDAEGIPRKDLGPGGRDTTRLAGSDPDLWAAIVQENADELEPALTALIAELELLRRAAADRDGDAVRGRLRAASAWAAARRG